MSNECERRLLHKSKNKAQDEAFAGAETDKCKNKHSQFAYIIAYFLVMASCLRMAYILI